MEVLQDDPRYRCAYHPEEGLYLWVKDASTKKGDFGAFERIIEIFPVVMPDGTIAEAFTYVHDTDDPLIREILDRTVH